MGFIIPEARSRRYEAEIVLRERVGADGWGSRGALSASSSLCRPASVPPGNRDITRRGEIQKHALGYQLDPAESDQTKVGSFASARALRARARCEGALMFGIDSSGLAAFLQVIMIDLVLAGDNAIVIGLAAAGLPTDLRRQAILIGIGAATLLRISFALIDDAAARPVTGLLIGRRPAAALGVLEDVARTGPTAARRATLPTRRWPAPTSTRAATRRARRARRSRRRLRRSSSPTCRCRSTTCWRSPAPRTSIPSC